MRKLISIGAMMISGIGFGSAQYAYDDPSASLRTLYVVVERGATESFDATKLDIQNASVTNVVKRGEGTICFDSADISSYTFDTRVENGICKVQDNGTFSARPCTVVVCDGGTFWNVAGGSEANFNGMTMYFEGRGYDQMGALYKKWYDWGFPFGSTLIMTGDAKVSLLGSENCMMNVDMRGYTLDVHFLGQYSNKWRTFSNMGTVNWIGEGEEVDNLEMNTWVSFLAGSDTTMTCSNLMYDVVDRSYPNEGKFNFPLVFKAGSWIGLRAAGNNVYREGSDGNLWEGPVVIDEPQLVVKANEVLGESLADVGFAFSGAVSGGGMSLVGLEGAKVHVTLKSAANSFTGGVSAVNAVLHDGANGAIIASGAPVAFTNSAFLVEGDGEYELPAAEFCGDCIVSNGTGRWNGTLVKTGVGTLDYKSSLGADVLDVREGHVDLRYQSELCRRAIAGCVEGRREIIGSYPGFETLPFDGAGNWEMFDGWIWSRTQPVLTNCVTQGMRMLYDKTRGYETGWASNIVVTYSGYLWNNSATNEVWAFGGHNSSQWVFLLDGNFIFGYSDWYGACQFEPNGGSMIVSTNTYLMTPGPHYFEYRSYVKCNLPEDQDMGPDRSGTWMEEGNKQWDKENGLLFNRTGICTKNKDDYQKLVDAGDGSLMTCALPSNIPEHIGTTEIRPWRIAFDGASFAPGTSVDLGGVGQEFVTMKGWPTTVDGDVTVKESWTIDPAEVGVGRFSIDGKLILADGVKLVFLDDGKPVRECRNCDIILGTASDGIVGTPSVDRSPHWQVFVDGNVLKARYTGNGIMLIVR